MPTPPKPLKLHKSQGTYREYRHGGNNPDPKTGRPDAPEWLDEEERDEWDRATADLEAMGLLHRCDRALLVAWVEAWGEFVGAVKSLRTTPRVSVAQSGAEYQNPMVGIKNQASKRMQTIATQFGLSPVARTRIQVAENKEMDPLNALLAKHHA